MPWLIWALCRNRAIGFLPLWDWRPVPPVIGRRCCGCRPMATIKVPLVGLNAKRKRRGEPEFRDAVWAADALPLIALREADRGAVVAWGRRGWWNVTSGLGQ